MPDFSDKRIGGARIVPHDPRNVKLEQIIDAAALPAVPSGIIDVGAKVRAWGMHQNDAIGDCVFAAQANQCEADSADSSAEDVVPDADVIGAYSRVTGYVPGNSATDNGTDPTAAANDWRTNGLGGRKIYGWAQVPAGNVALQRFALYYCGGLQFTLQLPVSAQRQSVWDVVPNDGGVWGGHEVFGVKHDPATGRWTVVTWGSELQMTQAFLDRYGWLTIAAMPLEWFDGSGNAPPGFNAAAFQRYLTIATGQPDPNPEPIWQPDANTVAWLTWRQSAGQYVLNRYTAGDVAGARAEEATIAQYEPELTLLLSGTAAGIGAPPVVPQ